MAVDCGEPDDPFPRGGKGEGRQLLAAVLADDHIVSLRLALAQRLVEIILRVDGLWSRSGIGNGLSRLPSYRWKTSDRDVRSSLNVRIPRRMDHWFWRLLFGNATGS